MHIPVIVGGEALAWTGDSESPFLIVSVGDEPMMTSRECGGVGGLLLWCGRG